MTDTLLRPDELAWIRANPERCRLCKHLMIFHSINFDTFGDECTDCDVDACDCHE